MHVIPPFPISIVVSVVLSGSRLIHSLPITAPTSPSAPSYVAGPDGRGTVSLIFSCVITLALCVWTAIHLNVPPKKSRTKWRRFLLKLRWAALALFAPEVVVWRAYVQWTAARELCKERNAITETEKLESVTDDVNANSSNEPTPQVGTFAHAVDSGTVRGAREKAGWPLELGYFAIMGGFEVKPNEFFKELCTLTPQGVMLMLKLGLLPDVDKNKIKDKSKADSLAKGVVCIQAVWMFIQTIARKASGLPITLLELNTLAHVACAILLYLLWWYKPQSVNEPEIISEIDPLLAAYLTSDWYQNRFKYDRDGDWLDGAEVDPMSDENGHSQSHSSLLSDDGPQADEWQMLVPENKSGLRVTGRITAGSSRRLLSNIRGALELNPNGVVMLLPGQKFEGIPFISESVFYLDETNVSRMRLLSDFCNSPKYAPLVRSGALPWPNKRLFLDFEASNMAITGNLKVGDKQWNVGWTELSDALPILAILSATYGGVHASSWNSHFPSFIEQAMWRAAACIVGAGGVVLVLFNILGSFAITWHVEVSAPLRSMWTVWELNDIFAFPMFFVLGLLMRGWLILYGLARVYLIVEAFISVRSLAVGAYDTVQWVNLLPHIG